MQLALLARCGNIASSVITSGGQQSSAAAPPKIRITDENERTVSFHSESAIATADSGTRQWSMLGVFSDWADSCKLNAKEYEIV